MSISARIGRVTIADVAKAAGVSLSTVDRVLNGRAPVRMATAKHIHDVAASLGYHLTGVLKERVQGKKVKYKLGFLLEQPDSAFYANLGAALTRATAAFKDDCEAAQVEFMKDISPDAVALRLRSLGERVDAVALVSADHSLISSEIDRLKALGVPVFALISDLSTPSRAGYVGLDIGRDGLRNHDLGVRTWCLARALGRRATWREHQRNMRSGVVSIDGRIDSDL